MRTLVVTALAFAVAPPLVGQAPHSSVQAFLDAEGEAATESAAQAIIDSGLLIDDVYRDLSRGRAYAPTVPVGRQERDRQNRDGQLHRYFYDVPSDYRPDRSYPVRFYLHGGVSRPEPTGGQGWWRGSDQLAGQDHIAVFPAAWDRSLWWQRSQVENLNGILLDLKRLYNIDENRVTITGVSDGGTGAYFFAFKDTTPWASFFPFIASPGVLLNPRVGADGRMHVANLINKPLYIVNGEEDRLYPVSSVEPYLQSFGKAGVPFEFHPNAGGHNTDFWPAIADDIERFHTNFSRDPLPDRVIWAADDPVNYGRAHWLVIDEIGPTEGDESRAALAGLTEEGESGIADATRNGNTVEIEAFHVRRLRLLLSPNEFDLAKPIRVLFNGREVLNRVVQPELETLLEWAARDQDRTMLFVAEVVVEVKASGPS